MNKICQSVGVITGAAAAISRDDIIFCLSLIVTIINVIIAALEMRKERATRKTTED